MSFAKINGNERLFHHFLKFYAKLKKEARCLGFSYVFWIRLEVR
ncbi:hypothetical protein B4144_2678 [Bacillus atrophaeus]|nr:hypothetical protein B4144_2678 [Bacillus atrophaeus]